MPRKPERIPAVMKALEAFWGLHPDLRFAQVLHMLYRPEKGGSADGLNVPFYEEEAEFSKRLADSIVKYRS